MDDPSAQDDWGDMLPIERCRRLLADEAAGLTDDEGDVIRRHAHAMARTLIEVYLHQPPLGDAKLRLARQDLGRG
jgi:hypothetical protein